MATTIETIQELQTLVIAGKKDWKKYGQVNNQIEGDYILFNYNQMAVYAGDWNYFEQISRGLILNRFTGEIVARPFDKFWNWGEGERRSNGSIISITEKMDGSLGILYRDNGQYKIATRGSMKSEQSQWATRWLKDTYDLKRLPDEYTLLFEIIYPENRIVIDYEGFEGLVLLAVRNRITGDYLPFFPDVYELAMRYGFPIPKTYTFNDLAQVIEQCGMLDANHEGFVIEFSDGSRFKFKGDRYLELHRLISSISYKNTLKAIAGGSLQTFMDSLPDEFLNEVKRWKADIENARDAILQEVEAVFYDAPKDTRKDFALWTMKYHKGLAPYLFGRLDGKPLEPMIYRALEDRKDECVLVDEV